MSQLDPVSQLLDSCDHVIELPVKPLTEIVLLGCQLALVAVVSQAPRKMFLLLILYSRYIKLR